MSRSVTNESEHARPTRLARTAQRCAFGGALTALWLLATATPLTAQTLLSGPTRIERAGNGTVVERLPDGGILVAGQFTGVVGGPSRAGIARFSSNGALVAAFDPDFEFSNTTFFNSIVVADGRAYVGGRFFRVDGQARAGLAAFDLANNALTDWDPAMPGSTDMRALAAAGGVIYVAGNFTSIGGAARQGLAAVDALTGTATGWNPGQVVGVRRALVGSDGLFIGGAFSFIGTPKAQRNLLAKLDLASGAVLAFDAAITGGSAAEVLTLRQVGSTLYIGGTFGSVGGSARNAVAAVEASSGALLAFNPLLNGGASSAAVDDIEVDGSSVFLCGRFGRVGSQLRSGAADVASVSGAAGTWNGNLLGGFQCADLLLDGDGVVATGSFDRVGNQPRQGLVRLARSNAAPQDSLPGLLNPALGPIVVAGPDGTRFVASSSGLSAAEGSPRIGIARYAPDGTVDSAFPDVFGDVRALLVDGSTLFVGGISLSMNGAAPFVPLVAIDLASGQQLTAPSITRTQAGATPSVSALALNGGDLLIGGRFDQVNGVASSGLAAVRLLDGVVGNTPVLFEINGPTVDLFAVGGGRVILSGNFVTVDGQLRSGLAALDAQSYALLPWTPVAGGAIFTMLATTDRVYFGGRFSQFGTPGGPLAPRNAIAAVDAVSAALLPWNPDVRSNGADCGSFCFVSALALDGDTLYAGGLFDSVGGQPRAGLAAVSASTGAVQAFDAALSRSAAVLAMARVGSVLTIGGQFERAAGARQTAIAAFDLSAAPPPDPLFANGFEAAP
jgi:hypothetical protein